MLRFLLVSWGFCLIVPSPGATGKPNIIIILADDLGYAEVSCFGGTLAETPHIDALARDCIRFYRLSLQRCGMQSQPCGNADRALSENTLIVFSSDNGPAGPGNTGPLRGKKGSANEGGHRVPTVACWPGVIEAGRVSEEPLMGADLFPTFAEMSGASLPVDLQIDGVSSCRSNPQPRNL